MRIEQDYNLLSREDILQELKDAEKRMQALQWLVRQFCNALSSDASMNKKAFKILCKMAQQAGSTQYPWWDKNHV